MARPPGPPEARPGRTRRPGRAERARPLPDDRPGGRMLGSRCRPRTDAPGEPAMERDIFTSEHEAFRDMMRSFIAVEIAPHHEQWERDGMVSRDVWLAAGRAGLLGIDIDEKYGGGGNPDYRYYLVMNEELARAGAHGPGFSVHNDIIGQYLQRLATPEQCQRWLPGYCSGEIITAIAMSEPGRGQRPAGDPHLGRARRRPLRAQRPEDLHLQRPAGRPGDRGGPDRPGRRAIRASACWWSSAAWPASSAAATWTRSACTPRTPPSCSSPTCGCRRRTCSAPRAAASSR